ALPVELPASALDHELRALDRLKGAHQDRPGNTFFFRNDVEHEMVAIAKINIGESRWAEHDLVAGRHSPGGVAPRVIFREIGFHFDDPAGRWALGRLME